MYFNQAKQGFTLIELLVVVLIIGILAAVALPQYQKAVEKSRVTEALTVLKTLQQGMDVYTLANGYENDYNMIEKLDVGLTVEEIQGARGQYASWSKNFVYFARCFSNDSCTVSAYRSQNPYGAFSQVVYSYYITYTKTASSGAWRKSYSEVPACVKNSLKGYFEDMGFTTYTANSLQCL